MITGYRFLIMRREHRDSTKAQLAVALAQGVPTGKWARSRGVPSSTAYRWAKDRKAGESCRRRTMDHAIGLMNQHSTWAADGIATIAREAKSDTVRLRACRAIVRDAMAVSKYSGLEARMADIETRLSAGAFNLGQKPRAERAGNIRNSYPFRTHFVPCPRSVAKVRKPRSPLGLRSAMASPSGPDTKMRPGERFTGAEMRP